MNRIHMQHLFILLLAAACVLAGSVPATAEDDPIVTYTIDVRLDAETKRLHASGVIRYTNRSDTPIPDLYFHLYLNAFKNDQSTYIREDGGSWMLADDGWGWVEIERMLIDGAERLDEISYVQPDDNNRHDQTVAHVPLCEPLHPGDTLVIELDFEAQLPKILHRTGYDDDFYLVAQWFPKLGVWEPAGRRGRTEAGWNCHQFHADSEFYADFGDYDVTITTPADFVLGATGTEIERSRDAGEQTIRFTAERVVDFTWTASPHYVREERTFRMQDWVTEDELRRTMLLHGILREDAALPDVAIILLLQPEHRKQADRHFRAVALAMKHFGLWYGPYPYPSLTLVDPARGAWGAGGMEYPRLITTGTSWLPPEDEFIIMGPEQVTVHEFGHQYWQTLVATNEFEDAWLDEGLTTYSTGLVMDAAYGPERPYISLNDLAIAPDNWFPVAKIDSRQFARIGVIRDDGLDNIAREAWTFYDSSSYAMNSYRKTAVVLYQLQHELGDNMMARVMRAYFQRWHFDHPGPRDFIDVAEEATGRDLDWFFDQLVFGTGSLDYAVDRVRFRRIRNGIGVFDTADGHITRTAGDDDSGDDDADDRYRSTVRLRNHGSIRYPVDIQIRFEDGLVRERWDGAYPWIEFEYVRSSEVKRVVIDPDQRLIIDTNHANNIWLKQPERRTDTRWMLHVLTLVQNLFQGF